MKTSEIIELFDYVINDYQSLRNDHMPEKFGYLMAVLEIFQALINYQKD